MSDSYSEWRDDVDKYRRLCGRFGESPKFKGQDLDCYGVHAKKLELRVKREGAKNSGGKTPIETEVKLPVDEKTLYWLEKELNKSWESTPWVRQENVIYRTQEGFVRFRRENGKTTLTVKGKNSGGRYNQRTESECAIPVDFFENVLRTAVAEGAVVYEKMRATYFEGDCTICLDNLSGRYFVEIEGTKRDIDRNISRLKLGGIPTEKRDYAEIVSELERLK
jgi:adenylate cyclase class IV